MTNQGITIVAITRRGIETALKIQKALDICGLGAIVYAPKKYSQPGVTTIETNFADFIKENYNKTKALVAVMASGIIIRAVAPLLESKLTDPPVIGVDAAGKFVISLLSGHIGGANDLTRTIAMGINAIPVITTASDALGKQSADELARTMHLSIQNPDSLVAVNSAIVNDGHLAAVLVGDIKMPLEALSDFDIKKVQTSTEAIEIIDTYYDAGIIITQKPLTLKSKKPLTILNAKRIIVGLGARKDTPTKDIVTTVEKALEQIHVPLQRVTAFATVDIKRSSQPMIDAVEALGAPLEFLSVDALRSVTYADLSPDSAMVQQKIGVGGVCERAALLIAGNNSKLILKKTKLNGTTVAVAEAE
ncbi:MAG: cobalamin biosynthesis protein [Nitrososphaerota archaeon]|jgi:cobalt-precorrin 5A hydrolase|nr:cobalamin biosynthesis protein [Nitrososphaerota archaeon]